jgi:hypothetical protein
MEHEYAPLPTLRRRHATQAVFANVPTRLPGGLVFAAILCSACKLVDVAWPLCYSNSGKSVRQHPSLRFLVTRNPEDKDSPVDGCGTLAGEDERKSRHMASIQSSSGKPHPREKGLAFLKAMMKCGKVRDLSWFQGTVPLGGFGGCRGWRARTNGSLPTSTNRE